MAPPWSSHTIRLAMHIPTFLLFILTTTFEVAAQPTTSSAQTTSDSSLGGPTPTTTGANRITYAHLPSCASECVVSAVQTIPCAPFVASCFCALPTDRIGYQLPVECVKEKCGQDDIDAEEKWRESACSGLTSTTTVGLASSVTRTTSTNLAAEATEICESGWKGCPRGLNGGCCPR